MFEKLNRNMVQGISFNDIPGWEEDDHLEAYNALLNGIGSKSSRKNIQTTLEAKFFFEKNYKPYLLKNIFDENNLYTGYFEPKLLASKIKTDQFHYPLYGLPSDADATSKLFNLTRKDLIENTYKEFPILGWLNNRIDLYFMHIQGSGLLEYPDGSFKRYIYSGKNNYKYTSIGKYLTENGFLKINEISMFKIKKWMEKEDKNYRISYLNKSFIFFKEDIYNKTTDHPKGQLGIRLSPFRSLAVDMSIYELNTPVWIKTKIPNKNNNSDKEFERLMIAQDQGSAIKGIFRGDIYFGSGNQAGDAAGSMKSKGDIVILKKLENLND
ncbi:MAG: MltA domain-containing protein [Hyphomicrobiales bacterium]|jgi:membrane-bound lytic murein transglycosylase A|nr:MltA domain-containing protein [Hyphomicrobiales bacterium]